MNPDELEAQLRKLFRIVSAGRQTDYVEITMPRGVTGRLVSDDYPQLYAPAEAEQVRDEIVRRCLAVMMKEEGPERGRKPGGA